MGLGLPLSPESHAGDNATGGRDAVLLSPISFFLCPFLWGHNSLYDAKWVLQQPCKSLVWLCVLLQKGRAGAVLWAVQLSWGHEELLPAPCTLREVFCLSLSSHSSAPCQELWRGQRALPWPAAATAAWSKDGAISPADAARWPCQSPGMMLLGSKGSHFPLG